MTSTPETHDLVQRYVVAMRVVTELAVLDGASEQQCWRALCDAMMRISATDSHKDACLVHCPHHTGPALAPPSGNDRPKPPPQLPKKPKRGFNVSKGFGRTKRSAKSSDAVLVSGSRRNTTPPSVPTHANTTATTVERLVNGGGGVGVGGASPVDVGATTPIMDVPSLVERLRLQPTNACVAERLRRQCDKDDAAVETIAKVGGIDVLLSCLRNGSDDSDLLVHVLYVLALLLRTDAHCNVVRESRGIPLLVAASRSAVHDVQVCAATALACMARLPANQEAISAASRLVVTKPIAHRSARGARGDVKGAEKCRIGVFGHVRRGAFTLEFLRENALKEGREDYDPTDEQSSQRRLMVDDNPCFLELLDTAGQEEFSAMQDSYMHHIDGYVVVYCVSDRASFDQVAKVIHRITRVNDEAEVPIVICGVRDAALTPRPQNDKPGTASEQGGEVHGECDGGDVAVPSRPRVVSPEEGVRLAESMSVPFFEVSALVIAEVQQVIMELIRLVRSYRKYSHAALSQ